MPSGAGNALKLVDHVLAPARERCERSLGHAADLGPHRLVRACAELSTFRAGE